MHLTDDLLQAHLDEALALVEAEAARAHLDGCPACRQRLEAARQRGEQVRAWLNALTPADHEQPRSSRVAYARLATRIHQIGSQPRRSLAQQIDKEKIQTMSPRRTLFTALAVLAVLAVVLTVPPVRAWGSSFLRMFRVEKVQVFTLDPAAMENIRTQMNANRAAIEQVFQDDLEINERGPLTPVASAAEAAQRAGFTPRLPGALENPKIAVKPGMNVNVTIDVEKHQAMMDAVGLGYQLPADVDGAVVAVEVADAVMITAGCDPDAGGDELANRDCVSLVQMPSPVINAPDGLDVPRIGEAMFIFLGMPPAEAQRLSQRIDWTSTLVLPIPADDEITYTEVQVDGVSGSLLREENRDRSMLIWVKDGMLYGLNAPGGADDIQSIAASLR